MSIKVRLEKDNYLKNVAIITKTLDGKFKILTLKNPMHEGAFGFKATSKAENEHNLEFKIGNFGQIEMKDLNINWK